MTARVQAAGVAGSSGGGLSLAGTALSAAPLGAAAAQPPAGPEKLMLRLELEADEEDLCDGDDDDFGDEAEEDEVVDGGSPSRARAHARPHAPKERALSACVCESARRPEGRRPPRREAGGGRHADRRLPLPWAAAPPGGRARGCPAPCTCGPAGARVTRPRPRRRLRAPQNTDENTFDAIIGELEEMMVSPEFEQLQVCGAHARAARPRRVSTRPAALAAARTRRRRRQTSFFRDNCHHFDDSDENKLAYTRASPRRRRRHCHHHRLSASLPHAPQPSGAGVATRPSTA